jgi:hypothetical protein
MIYNRYMVRIITSAIAVLILVAGCTRIEPQASPLPTSQAPQPTLTSTITTQPSRTTTPTQSPEPTPTPPLPRNTSTPKPPTETSNVIEHYIPPSLIPVADPMVDLKLYGEEYNDWAYDILLLADGGTLIAGQVNNTGPSHRITPGNARLIRTDAEGNIIWQRDYGGDVDSMFYSLIQVGEDEYVVLGEIAASYERQEQDFYLVKIDGEGNEVWSQTYGGPGTDVPKMVRQTADGGFILAGDRADAIPIGGLYRSHLVLIKTDAEGNQVWTQTYGNKILYLGWGVAQTPDGGYVLIGWEAKTIPDRGVIAIKTDALGEVEWSRTWNLDPGDRDGGFDLILTPDGYIVIAGIQSMDTGLRRAVAIKVDLEGNEIWVKTFGEEGEGSEFWDIMQDLDGSYVMDGVISHGINPTSEEKAYRGYILKTDPHGEVVWQYSIGGEQYDRVHFSSGIVLPDGGYILVGAVIRSGEAYSDMLWLKLDNIQGEIP